MEVYGLEDESTEDALTIQEKAKLYLQTWKKQQLVEQLLYCASSARMGKWAEDYDRERAEG